MIVAWKLKVSKSSGNELFEWFIPLFHASAKPKFSRLPEVTFDVQWLIASPPLIQRQAEHPFFSNEVKPQGALNKHQVLREMTLEEILFL